MFVNNKTKKYCDFCQNITWFFIVNILFAHHQVVFIETYYNYDIKLSFGLNLSSFYQTL